MLLLNTLALATAAASSCPSKPAAAMLALPYEAFDTATGKYGWRTLLAAGCEDAAVATLGAYLAAHAARMTARQRDEVMFHMGQALVMSGRAPEALPHFRRAAGAHSSPDWKAYVDAHVAYVRKDRRKLVEAIVAYARVAKHRSMRLRVMHGLLACIDKPYMKAVHCRM